MLGRRERGFTLTELLLVLVILGLLVAVVAVSVVGLIGRGGEESYKTDKRTIQMAVSAFYSDLHLGPDTTSNTWGDVDGTMGHYMPTKNGARAPIVTSYGAVDGEGNPILYIDGNGNGFVDAGEPAGDVEIDAAAVWMGLLVNEARAATSGGESNRGRAAPAGNESALYLQEIPESAMAPGSGLDYNGGDGGGYCWIVGKEGAVYGAYKVRGIDPDGAGPLPTADYWFAGYHGSYP